MWCDNMCDVAWPSVGVEPVELSEIAENRDVLGVFLRLLSPRSSPDEMVSGNDWKYETSLLCAVMHLRFKNIYQYIQKSMFI